MAASISRVRRRRELRAVGQVDLVAVVGGRVVRRGDLHPGHRAELAHRERQHRRRQRPRQHPHRRSPRRPAPRPRPSANASDPCRASRPTTTVPRTARRAPATRPGRRSRGARRPRSSRPARPAPARAARRCRTSAARPSGRASSSTAAGSPPMAAASTCCSSVAGGRVGVVGDPARNAASRSGRGARRHARATSVAQQRAHALGRGRTGGQHLLVVQRLPGHARRPGS